MTPRGRTRWPRTLPSHDSPSGCPSITVTICASSDNGASSFRDHLRGAVLDVVVDVRRGSPSFGRHVAVELDDENRRQCWIPRGFAHGFLVRSDTADFFYKCDEVYSPADEIVLRWDDPALAIDWQCAAPVLSPRDREGRSLAQLDGLLPRYEPA